MSFPTKLVNDLSQFTSYVRLVSLTGTIAMVSNVIIFLHYLLFCRIIWTIEFEKLFRFTFFSVRLIRSHTSINFHVKNHTFRTRLQVRLTSATIPKFLAGVFGWPSKKSICSWAIFRRLWRFLGKNLIQKQLVLQ